MIGDPSGKSEERNLLNVEVLRANVAGMEKQLRRFLDFDCGPNSALLVNNYDWMGRFGYLEFLRDIGKHFPVNVMLSKDSVKARLERTDSGLSYTEFSYMLLQAYDFVYLNEHYGCELQAGGSDQWGNITAGIDLARRIRGVQLHGITCPLLTKSDGTKMGKTESGALWLSADKTSPYKFYQYWYNTQDADVGKCLRYFTDLCQAEIEQLENQHAADPGQRAAQKRLAADLTRLVHGDDGAGRGPEGVGNPVRRGNRQIVGCAAYARFSPTFPARNCPVPCWRARESPSSTPCSRPVWPRARAKPAARSARAGATSTIAAWKASMPG